MKVVAAALAALTLCSPALAGTVESPFGADTATLSLAGLDLATAEGQQRLAIRIDQAARAVCGSDLSNIHLDLARKARACRADVATQVRDQVEARVAAAAPAGGVQIASR